MRGVGLALTLALSAACGETVKCKCEVDYAGCTDHAQNDASDSQGAFDTLPQDDSTLPGDAVADMGSRLPDGAPSDQAGEDKVSADNGSEDVQATPDHGLGPDGSDSDNGDGSDTQVPQGPFEFRGIWVTRWDFDSAAAIASIMEDLSAAGFNAVMFQVRGNADAYYDSNFEPWAKGLSGTLGKNPGWDPLAVAVEEAHSRGLEIHAWVNTFTAWTGANPPPESDPPHILYAHPDWRQADESGTPMAWNNSYTFVSPGIPGVREHLTSVMVDIVSNYDVDGLHFDYVRYAGAQYSHDPWSEEAYSAAKTTNPSLAWGDFQRDLLSTWVSDTYSAIGAARPDVKVTAAVWGIYKETFGWGGTSEGFYDYYQDSHRWAQEGYIDAICPMIYWPLTDPKGGWTDFATLVDDHNTGKGARHLYAGMKADYSSFDEIVAEVEYLRTAGADGFVLFSYSTLTDAGYLDDVATTLNTPPASPPPMAWK